MATQEIKSYFHRPIGDYNPILREVLSKGIRTDEDGIYIYKIPTHLLPGRDHVNKEQIEPRYCTPAEISAILAHHGVPWPAITDRIPCDLLDLYEKTGKNPYDFLSWDGGKATWNVDSGELSESEGSLSDDEPDRVPFAPFSKTPTFTLGGSCFTTSPIAPSETEFVPEVNNLSLVISPNLSLKILMPLEEIRKHPFATQVDYAVANGLTLQEIYPNTTSDGKKLTIHGKAGEKDVYLVVCSSNDPRKCSGNACKLGHSNRIRFDYWTANSSLCFHPVVTPRYCQFGPMAKCTNIECAFNHLVTQSLFDKHRAGALKTALRTPVKYGRR